MANGQTLFSMRFRIENFAVKGFLDMDAPEGRRRIVPILKQLRRAFRMEAERRPVQAVRLDDADDVFRPDGFHSDRLLAGRFRDEGEILPTARIADFTDEQRMFFEAYYSGVCRCVW